MRTKSTRRELIEFGHPVDHKIGGLTITCRGEMTPLRKKILAAQIADERASIARAIRGRNQAYSAWMESSQHINLRPAEAAEYRAWCKANKRQPIWEWTPTVTITNGASIIELRGDAIDKADRWLALCKKVPPKDGEPPPLPEARHDLPQRGYNEGGP